jgi:hypothetical protein
MERMMKKSITGLLAASVLCALCACSDALLDEKTRLLTEQNRPKSLSPADGTIITAHEIITFVFQKGMDPSSVTISGDIGSAAASWSTQVQTNDTLALNYYVSLESLIKSWSPGESRSVTLTVNTEGKLLTYTYHYSVFNGVCVSEEGDDGGWGTAAQPLATIQDGITKAGTLYNDGPSEVHVSGGTYTLTSSTGRIEMKSGVLVLGGYAQDWKSRNWKTYTTTITDQRTLNDGAVVFPSRIDSSTVFEGFTVNAATAGSASTTSAIRIQSSSPTIRNNLIYAGGDASNAARYGICIDNASDEVPSPDISNNTINYNNQGGGSLTSTSAGIYIGCNSSAHIHDNVIYAGNVSSNGAGCASILMYSNTAENSIIIERNSLYGGSGGDPNYPSNAAFYVAYSTVPIVFRNNLVIHEAQYDADNNRYGVYYFPDQAGSIEIRNNTIAFSSVGSSSNRSCGIFLDSGVSPPIIRLDNNIILYTGVNNPSNAFCIYENANIVPASVLRNDLYGLNTGGAPVVLYHDYNGDRNLTLEELNNNSPVNNNASYNISVNPNLAPLTFRPGATTPNEVRTGGADGGSLTWGYSNDHDLRIRTGSGGTGWTMGCYELD